MSAIRASRHRNIVGDEQGTSLITFGFMVPILFLTTFMALEFALISFEFHRASEATRRGARTAVLENPILDPADFALGASSICTSTAGTVTCTGAGTASAASFAAIVDEMALIRTGLQAENVEIEYRDVGLGDPDTPGGIIPQITVRLVGLTQNFRFLSGLPGFPGNFTYPDFAASQIGAGLNSF